MVTVTVRVAVPPSATDTPGPRNTVATVSVVALPQLLQRNHSLGLLLLSDGARLPRTANQYSVPAASPVTVLTSDTPITGPDCPEAPCDGGGSGMAT